MGGEHGCSPIPGENVREIKARDLPMTMLQRKVVELLARGLKPTQVTASLGCGNHVVYEIRKRYSTYIECEKLRINGQGIDGAILRMPTPDKPAPKRKPTKRKLSAKCSDLYDQTSDMTDCIDHLKSALESAKTAGQTGLTWSLELAIDEAETIREGLSARAYVEQERDAQELLIQCRREEM